MIDENQKKLTYNAKAIKVYMAWNEINVKGIEFDLYFLHIQLMLTSEKKNSRELLLIFHMMILNMMKISMVKVKKNLYLKMTVIKDT